MFGMKRREFITLLGGAAAAWPLAAPAQQRERMRRIAFLHPYAENDPEVLARVVAFRQGLEALGWTENRNIRIEHRYSGGDFGQIQAYATELVRSAPDLIAGSGTPIIAALKQATDTIPIVFSVTGSTAMLRRAAEPRHFSTLRISRQAAARMRCGLPPPAAPR
jgi:putative tryptophan/tyrosine transport system substrate-binding protein